MMSPTPDRTPLRNPLALRYPDKSALGVRLPEDWVVQDDDHGADHPIPVPWRLGPAGGEPRLLIDAMFDALREPGMTVQELEVELRRTMVAYEGQALETVPALNAIRSTAGDGLWFLVTDAHPKPDEFLYMTRGALISGTSMVSFTVLTNEGEDAMWLAALSIVATTTLIAAQTADEAPAVVAGSPVTGAFLGMTRADEASLFVQDFPELLHADVVSALLAPFGNDLKRAPARVRVAYYCLQRVAAGGLSFAVGPAAFDEISDWMLQLVTALAQTAAPELATLRARVLTRLDAMTDLVGADLYLRNWLRLSLVDDLLRAGMADRRMAPRVLEDSVAVFDRPGDRFLRARAQAMVLGWMTNDLTGERAERVEAAIQGGEAALRSLEFSGLRTDWATLQLRLGRLFVARTFGARERNLAEADARFHLALSASEPGSSNALTAHSYIGLAGLRGAHDPATIASVASHFETVLAAAQSPASLAGAQLNLGNARLLQGATDIEALEQAIQLFKSAEVFFTRASDAVNWAGIQHNLGAAYRAREIGDNDANAAEAERRFELALEVRTLAERPAEHRASSVALAAVQMKRSRFEAALSHLSPVVAAEALGSDRLALRTERRDAWAHSQRLYAEAAFCLLKLGRFSQAIETVEKGRARELQQILAERAGWLPDIRRMMRDVALTDAAPLVTDSAAQRAARETVRRQHETLDVQVNADAWPLGEGAVFVPATAEALLAGITGDDLIVMTVLSEVGAATIIVAAGARELTASDVVWHANFSLDHAEQLLIGSKRVGLERGWLPAYFDNRRNAPVWQSTIRETGRLLWNGLVAEIDVALEARRISAAMRVVIIPPPELALLPWHASWRTVDGQRRYLADDATIRYVPSLAVLAALRRSQAARPPSGAGVRSSLVVADTEQNLPFAAIEGRRVAALARTAPDAALIGEAASFAAVLTGVPGKDLLHFACHGTYLIDDPMWSWLSLGRSGWDIAGTTGNLRLFEIVTTWRGLAASLVTLSACETGIPEVKGVPSESLSLASAWLAAGVLTVVSSFWIVDDFCTLMFMTRFYTEYFDADGANGRSDAATALYEAQRWVRSASAKALAGAVEALIEAPPDISVDDIERLRAKRRAFEAMPADAKPYSEPYWWAGFGVSGL